MKWRFAAKFLIAFAAFLVAWWAVDFPAYYRTVVLTTAQLVSPVVNGWWLEFDRAGSTSGPLFRSGTRELPLLLQLPALSMGVVPFLSLVAATPGLGWKRVARVGVVGVLCYLLLHVIVVLLYPLILDRASVQSDTVGVFSKLVTFLKDTLGVFSGLVAFVVAPLGLWFALTYPTLRSLWQLTFVPAHK